MSVRNRWLFDLDELMASTPSRSHGISYENELLLRQEACKFLYEMMNQLTHSRGDHLATGVAAVFINRFFKFHSFHVFDLRDIAAACLFLAGKNEDSPRKLKYVVTQWWHLKFPDHKVFSSERQFLQACDLITKLESIILMTLSFDVNVDLPHQYVLRIVQQIEKGRSTHKEMVKTAYYLSTDIMLVTDWSIRYSCISIATASIAIAAYFHDVDVGKIDPLGVGELWYQVEDRGMTLEKLNGMVDDFLEIFANRPDLHIGTMKRLDPKGKVKVVVNSSPCDTTSSLLPPPPAAPILQPKKVDIMAYKERQKQVSAVNKDSPRQSFLPDVQNPKELKRELERHEQQQRQYHHHQHQQRIENHQNHNHHQEHQKTNHQQSQHHHHNHRHNQHHEKSNHQNGSQIHRPSTSSSHNGEHRSRSNSRSQHNGQNGHNHHQYREEQHHSHSTQHYNNQRINDLSTPMSASSSNDGRKEAEGKRRMAYQNELQPSEKRYKHENSAGTSNTVSNNTSQMSAYAVQVAAFTSSTLINSNGKTIQTNSSFKDTSAYLQMCNDIRLDRKSIDPSPPTISPPLAAPPQPPILFQNEELEDGELR